MRARSGKNEPVSPKNKKNRPVVDVVIFWLRTHNRPLFQFAGLQGTFLSGLLLRRSASLRDGLSVYWFTRMYT
jgi:hypothetical protein